MCGLSCLEIVHYVPHILARAVYLSEMAHVCVFMTIYVLSCGVNAAVQNVPTDMQIWSCGCVNVHICACSHACLWRSVTDCNIHLCAVIILKMSRWKSASLTTGRRTGVFLAEGGHPFRTPRLGPSEDVRRWVPRDEGTYSIPTMLIRDVTLCEEKTRVEIRSHFSRFFPRRHLAV